jgi:Raf kinase inhibitor-like YbhB/YbcL family protein
MSNKRLLLPAVFLAALFFASLRAEGEGDMKIKSPAFEDGKYLPKRYTCDGEGVNPPLTIEGIPTGTKSLALISDDPDAPMGTFIHWVVYDIPVISDIKENSIPGTQGVNTTGELNYCSPCPPSGTHRYFFKVYALDGELKLEEGASARELENAMKGHILGKAEIVGLYKRR